MMIFQAKAERAYKHNTINKGIEYISCVSFAFYLYHMFIVNVFSSIHVLVGMPWCIRWLICLIVTIVVVEILKRMIPHKYRWCFGV